MSKLISGFSKLTKEEQTKIRSCAIYGAYIKQGIGPPIKYLVTDDAKNLVFWKRHQLCWVHEIRKYKLLDLYGHSEIVDEVITLLLPIKAAWTQIPESAKQEAYEMQRQKRQATV